MNTLIVTGTIRPLVKIKYCDPQVRCREYMTNLKRYICDTNFDRILFAENSGYPVGISELEELAAARGKCFQMLDASGNADRNSMSTGEARILQHVLAMCADLKDEDIVWKVSGRIYIRNANALLRSAAKQSKENIFLYAPKYDSLQTWFFRAKVGDLKSYFLTEVAVDRMRSGCIEYTWMDIWRENYPQIIVDAFRLYPDAEGINSSGNPYTLSRLAWIKKQLLLWLGYFKPSRKNKIDRSGL